MTNTKQIKIHAVVPDKEIKIYKSSWHIQKLMQIHANIVTYN